MTTPRANWPNSFARDNVETKFLDWRPLPETIAVLPELTLGGVQMDLTQALVRDAQEGWLGQPQGVEFADIEKASNDRLWRMAADPQAGQLLVKLMRTEMALVANDALWRKAS